MFMCHSDDRFGDRDKGVTEILQTEVQLGRQGRLVIPAELRRAMAVTDGDQLIARVEDGRLILEKRSTVRDRIKSRFAVVGPEIALADELVADRRAAGESESSA